MALIIVSGLPCSGRSSITTSLTTNFEQRLSPTSPTSTSTPRRLLTISDNTVHTPRSSYAAQTLEKPARASYLSAVSRGLGKGVVVLADGGAGLNIKGFRYQLWCAAREQGVRCVTLHVYASPEECKRRNAARREAGEESYDDETIEDMLKRYEEPNAMTRWDSPLFLVKSEPPIADADAGPSSAVAAVPEDGAVVDSADAIPYDEIWKAATETAPRKAPAVVVPHRQTTSNYLSALESVSQSIINHILTLTSASPTPPTSLPIPLPSSSSSQKLTLTLKLPPSATERGLTLSALQRLRRQFVKMHMTGLASGSEIASARDADTRALQSRGGGQEKGAEGPGSGTASSGGGSTIEDEIARKFVGWLERSL